MGELLFQELEPAVISRPTAKEIGYDFLVGFPNAKGGINTFAVQIKATERPPRGRVSIARHTFERLANSNIPGLLLVADVKQNRLYYAWLREKGIPGTGAASLPLVALDEESKAELRARLQATGKSVQVAG